MRNVRRQVRHERSVRRERSTAPAPPVVAVTGAARGVGQALAISLAESPLIDRVVAIDDHRGDAARVTWRVADVRDPTLAARLPDRPFTIKFWDGTVLPASGGDGPIPNPWRRPGLREVSTAVPPVNNARASQP